MDTTSTLPICRHSLFCLILCVISILSGRADAATSPLRRPDNLSKSQTALVQSGVLNIDQCKIGDIVLVIWDSAYRNYRILQDSTHLYFLHSECVDSLGLTAPGSGTPKMYCIGKVTRKDYCHAKKVGNRYNIPRGTKFFRLKVKPLYKEAKAVQDVERVSHMSQSESAACSGATVVSPAISRSLPSSPTKAEDEAKGEMEASAQVLAWNDR